MIREEDAERFLLLSKAENLALNELALMAGERLPEVMQRDIRRAIGEYWASMMDISDAILAAHPALRERNEVRDNR
jgi:hypothetical protein